MSFRDLQRREYMRIDYSNHFDVGKSLKPTSFRKKSGQSMNKVSEKSMDDTPRHSPQMYKDDSNTLATRPNKSTESAEQLISRIRNK